MSSQRKSAKTKVSGADQAANRRRRERELEEGLEDTFPASDAVAVLEPAPDREADEPKKR